MAALAHFLCKDRPPRDLGANERRRFGCLCSLATAGSASTLSIATVATTAGLAFAACHLVGNGIRLVPGLLRSFVKRIEKKKKPGRLFTVKV